MEITKEVQEALNHQGHYELTQVRVCVRVRYAKGMGGNGWG